MSEELKTPQEWAAADGLQILDPDGWRTATAPDFDAPTTRGDYLRRMAVSTIGPLNWGKK